MPDTHLTVVGNLVDDPELRFTPSGLAVANFRVASTPRVKSASGDWEDGESMFLSCTVWRALADHVAESLSKGCRVILSGRLRVRSYEARDGSGRRTSWEVEVDDIGPSLSFATAVVTRVAAGARAAAPLAAV